MCCCRFVTKELISRGYNVTAFAREKAGIKGKMSKEDTAKVGRMLFGRAWGICALGMLAELCAVRQLHRLLVGGSGQCASSRRCCRRCVVCALGGSPAVVCAVQRLLCLLVDW